MPAPITLRKRVLIEANVVLATRQLGGGSLPKVVDRDLWLRPAAVRGALRFWWRALYAQHYETVQEVRKAEERIFGSVGGVKGRTGPSTLSVTVAAARPPDSQYKPWSPAEGDPSVGAYFPARGEKGAPASDLLKPGAAATVRVEDVSARMGASDVAQVQTSLAAFVVFGGSGSRTRRGAGSIAFATAADAERNGAPMDLEGLTTWLAGLPKAGPHRHDHVFSLARREAVYRTPACYKTGDAAQQALLDLWRDVRQWRVHPPDWVGKAGWGRTEWPEADAIRIATRSHAVWNDGTAHTPKAAHEGKAPRAHFGLPIVVKFKDDTTEKTSKTSRDPKPVVHEQRGRLLDRDPPKVPDLIPAGGDRYASPVLLSVVRVAFSGDDQFAGVVVITPSLLSTKVVFRTKLKQVLEPGSWRDGSARKRLLQILAERSYQKVWP